MAWVGLCTLALVTVTGIRWTLHWRLGALHVVRTRKELGVYSAEYILSDLVFVKGICPCSGLWMAALGGQRETRWVFNYSLHHTKGYDCAGCPVMEGGTRVKVEYCCCRGGGSSWSDALGIDSSYLITASCLKYING